MISQISKLKGFGIFSDFNCTDATVRPFKRFNLIYGWNGSGKSTLTKLFACLEKKKLMEDFSDSNFSVSILDQVPITHNNISENVLNVRVFNEDFIADNIQWNNDKSAKSILLLSEEKIEEKKQLNILKGEINILETSLRQDEIRLSSKISERDTFLSATAKTIKEAFKIIDTSDTHYFNYNKTKLENFISGNSDALLKDTSILKNEALIELTTSIKPTSKPELTFELNDPLSDKIVEAETKIKEILASSLVNESIARLEENPEIQIWVEKGFEIHKNFKSDNCEYCGQIISPKRIAELENHFNDEYKKFITRLDSALDWVNTVSWTLIDLPDASAVYDEFQNDYLNEKAKITGVHLCSKDLIDDWRTLLKQKKENPFKPVQWELRGISQDLKELEVVTKKLNAIRTSHNLKTKNFNDVLAAQKTKLELHYSAESIKEQSHYVLLNDINRFGQNIKKSKQIITDKKKEAFEIEKELTDEVKGAAHFNDM